MWGISHAAVRLRDKRSDGRLKTMRRRSGFGFARGFEFELLEPRVLLTTLPDCGLEDCLTASVHRPRIVVWELYAESDCAV